MKNLSQISVILMKNLSHFGHLRLAGYRYAVRFSVRVSFTVRVSVRVIQVAILSCNCGATQPRRRRNLFYVV